MRSVFSDNRTRSVCTLLLLAVLAGACESRETVSTEINWYEPASIATGDAFQGPWRMNESQFLYVDDPTVAMNNKGDIGVAWANQAQQDIFFRRYDADGAALIEQPVNVSASPDIFSWLPRLVFAADDADTVYILWQEIVFSGGSHGGEIFFARSTDGGQSFSDPLNLSNTTAGAGKGRLTPRRWHNGSLDLAQVPDGTLLAAWTEYEGGLRVSHSTDGGQTFSEPVRVNSGEAPPARAPALAVTEETAYLAWTVGDDESADIRLARSDDGGASFDEPRIVHQSEGHADAPGLAVDRQGDLHLVYAESSAGPWQRYHIRYTRSGDGGEAFDTPRQISGAHDEQFASVNFPALHLDGEDNLYVLWELFHDAQQRPRGLGLTCAGRDAEIFAAPVVIPGSDNPAHGFSGSLQGHLMNKLAVGAEGALAVVNSTFRPGDASHIWLFRGRAESCSAANH